MNETDEAGRGWIREMLTEAADGLEVKVDGPEVFGWRDRSVSAAVTSASGPAWLRVVTEQTEWTEGEFWSGNLDASVIEGVAKPRIIRHLDWIEGPVSVRAELMTLAAGHRCSPTPELHANVTLPESWWISLTGSLSVLKQIETTRTVRDAEDVELQLLGHFGVRVDTSQLRWTAAHADFHWANLMGPELSIVDWEGWGMAPAGYDAATLYLHALQAPATARQVHDRFRDVLDSLDGLISQLVVTGRLLRRILRGDYPDLAVPLHHNAREVISRLDPR